MRRALPRALAGLVLAGCGSSQRLADAAKYAPADAQAFVAVSRNDPHRNDFMRLVLGRVPHAHGAAFALVGGKLVVVPTTGTPPAHPLADDARFRAALQSLPSGLRGIAYVRGDVAAARLRAIPGQLTTLAGRFRTGFRARTRNGGSSIAHVQYRWAVGWLTRDGMVLRAHSGGLPVAQTEFVRGIEILAPAYAPAIFDEIPADAQSVLDVSLLSGAFENLPKLPRPIAALFPGSPASVTFELDQVFQGETALYTRSGGETTLVTQPADLFAALKAIALLPPLRHLHRTFLGGQLVLSTSARGIAAFRGGGPKLASRLQLPGLVTGVLYRAHRLLGWGGTIGHDAVFTVRFERGSG